MFADLLEILDGLAEEEDWGTDQDEEAFYVFVDALQRLIPHVDQIGAEAIRALLDRWSETFT